MVIQILPILPKVKQIKKLKLPGAGQELISSAFIDFRKKRSYTDTLVSLKKFTDPYYLESQYSFNMDRADVILFTERYTFYGPAVNNLIFGPDEYDIEVYFDPVDYSNNKYFFD